MFVILVMPYSFLHVYHSCKFSCSYDHASHHGIHIYFGVISCLVNDASESDVGAAEGEAPEVDQVEETPAATEGKHLAYLSYVLVMSLMNLRV